MHEESAESLKSSEARSDQCKKREREKKRKKERLNKSIYGVPPMAIHHRQTFHQTRVWTRFEFFSNRTSFEALPKLDLLF